MKFNKFLEFIGITRDEYNKFDDDKKKYLITYLYENNNIAATHNYLQFKINIKNLIFIFTDKNSLTPKMIKINNEIENIIKSSTKTKAEIHNDDTIINNYYYEFTLNNIDDNQFDTDIEVEYEKYFPNNTSKLNLLEQRLYRINYNIKDLQEAKNICEEKIAKLKNSGRVITPEDVKSRFGQDGDAPFGGKLSKTTKKSLDKCTLAELKERAAKRGIKVSGLNKSEIVTKLRK